MISFIVPYSKDRSSHLEYLPANIAKYFKDKKYKGRILGKTGYIAGVKAFSGICSTISGDYIFSILTNNANAQTRNAINDIAKAIIDEGDSQH